MYLKILPSLAMLAIVSLALADDLELADGTIIKDARIIDKTPAALIVVNAEGVQSVPFEKCLLETQAIHGYDPAAAQAYLEEQRQAAAEREAEAARQKSQREARLVAAWDKAAREDERSRSIVPPSSKIDPKSKRPVRNLAFGYELGKRFEGKSSPYKTDGAHDYYTIDANDLPNPSDYFYQYSILVGTGSRKVVGIEASGLMAASYLGGLAKVSEELNRRYGPAATELTMDKDGKHETLVWRDGQMEIRLTKERLVKLTYRLPL